MSEDARSSAGGRLLLAFEMADLGIALMRENLRKRFPADSADALNQRMADWLAGPSPLDTDLRLGKWPR
jgi:hypothetical protein